MRLLHWAGDGKAERAGPAGSAGCIERVECRTGAPSPRTSAPGPNRNNPVPRSTQPCIPPVSLNRVPASVGGKGGNVASAGWQVTLCDPMWHVSSRSGVATLRTAIHLLLTYLPKS